MGGRITVDNSPDRGSTFAVCLPLARAHGVKAGPNPEPAIGHQTPDARRQTPAADLRVLAAEDNPNNQVVLKTLLSALGIEPVIVANGQEALDAWRQEHWDIILMDI